MIGEYLACLRVDVCASTYNGRVCVLREIFRTLADKAGLEYDPWEGVRLRPDDSHSRRELTMSELERLLMAAKRADVETAKKSVVPWRNEWRKLFLVGIYTGMRLGDCCRLSWTSVNLSSGIIQLVPQKTKRHHGRIVTIPIHPALRSALEESPENERNGYVLSTLADYYMKSKWRVGHELGRIFRAAGIVTSIQIEGRRTKTPEATFHSLRHTFVSFAANAGVPLHIVQSIVGHESTAMTRHYYHENEDALRQAVAAIPAIGTDAPLAPAVARVAPMAAGGQASAASAVSRPEGVPSRLRRLDRYRAKGLITEVEYDEARQRIIGEI
jgi:integrase